MSKLHILPYLKAPRHSRRGWVGRLAAHRPGWYTASSGAPQGALATEATGLPQCASTHTAPKDGHWPLPTPQVPGGTASTGSAGPALPPGAGARVPEEQPASVGPLFPLPIISQRYEGVPQTTSGTAEKGNAQPRDGSSWPTQEQPSSPTPAGTSLPR